MQDIINGRCGWCGTDELYVKYHDEELGKTGNRRQDTIRVSCIGKCPGRTKLDNHPQKAGRLPQSLFAIFDTAQVAQMTDEDVERLMHFDGIVKNRLKIKSTITNAKQFLAIQKEFGSFYNYTLSFFPDRNLLSIIFSH